MANEKNLNRGGNEGNVFGAGRTASAIRRKMRGALDQRLSIALEIADNPETSTSDRLKALDFLAKYGCGTVQRINVNELSTAQLRALLEEEGEEDSGDEG